MAVWLVAAAELLASALSPEWVGRNVLGRPGADPYMRSHALAPAGDCPRLDRFRYQHRVLQLADMLYNFQAVPGIDGRIARLLTEGVESAVAELESAELLYRAGIPFCFVDPQGTRGLDYDLDATIGDHLVACEVKCKLESTDLSEGTCKGALTEARKQLPTDQPGLVFVRIPEAWVADSAIAGLLGKVLADVFRNTSRISAVVFTWEEWYDRHAHGARFVGRYRIEHNPRARTPLHQLRNLRPVSQVEWGSIREIIGVPMPELWQSLTGWVSTLDGHPIQVIH